MAWINLTLVKELIMKSHVDLLVAVVQDIGLQCGTTLDKDIDYILSRIEGEGLYPFLGITLPTFCDWLEEALRNGSTSSLVPPGFRRANRGSLPAFLQGLTRKIFDDNGCLLDKPDTSCIRYIRQICRMYKKCEVACTPERVQATVSNYVQVEEELASWDPRCVSDDIWNVFLQISDIICSRLDVPDYFPIRHGTGAVSDGLTNFGKYQTSYWYHRSQLSFPADLYCFRGTGFWLDNWGPVEFLPPEEELPVKVTTVPKTLKSPRIIAMEPSHQQMLQQGIMRYMYDWFRRSEFLSLDLSNQSHNHVYAREGSRSGLYATLDLSEASDRVHACMVWHMLRRSPLRSPIFATRSQQAKLPDGQVIPLVKFASMGSATCFPVESLYFNILALVGLHLADNRRPSDASIRCYRSAVRVYGDDIIVPTYSVPDVIRVLEAFKLRVNRHKSFWTGKFRESCGEDYYDGEPVKVVYSRHTPPKSRREAEKISSWCSMAWQLYHAGYLRAASRAFEFIDRLVPLYPGSSTSPYLSSPFSIRTAPKQFDTALQKPLSKVFAICITTKPSFLDGVAAWRAFVDRTEWETIRSTDSSILAYDGRPSIAIKTVWTGE